MTDSTSMPNTKNARIIFLTGISEKQVKQVYDIMKESENPYESFVNTFGHDAFVYMPSTNTFYFLNEGDLTNDKDF